MKFLADKQSPESSIRFSGEVEFHEKKLTKECRVPSGATVSPGVMTLMSSRFQKIACWVMTWITMPLKGKFLRDWNLYIVEGDTEDDFKGI